MARSHVGSGARGLFRWIGWLAGRGVGLLVLLGLGLALGVAGGVASSRPGPKPITGRLSSGGLAVIAVGYNGKAVVAKGPNFKLVPPDRHVTLQLRDSHGKYAGPVVLAGGGSKVTLGVNPGASLGRIVVLRGYARVVRQPKGTWIDRGRWAHAKKGVPLGNGLNYGLIRISDHSGSRGPGGDNAHSGVPNDISIDADADGVIDVLKPAGLLRARAAATGDGPSTFMSQISLDFGSTLNADAASTTVGEIDAMLVKNLTIKLLGVPSGDLVELDCGGLAYCMPGGTGQIYRPPEEGGLGPAFPSCCDPDGNGFGNLSGPGAVPVSNGPSGSEFALQPNATSAQVGSGDTTVLRTTTGGVLTQTPLAVGFVFNTVPAVSAYDDGAGDTGAISYPVPAGAPGTQSNPLPVAAGSSGDVVLALAVWRPQRRGIATAGEANFMDVGHLKYSVYETDGLIGSTVAPSPTPGATTPTARGGTCPVADMSTSDPSLSPIGTGPTGGLSDNANDQAANPANRLSFSIDLTQCAKDNGASGLPIGANGAISLAASVQTSGSDHASQTLWIKRVS